MIKPQPRDLTARESKRKTGIRETGRSLPGGQVCGSKLAESRYLSKSGSGSLLIKGFRLPECTGALSRRSLRHAVALTVVLLVALILTSCQVRAGFWTFYFPNFLKPSGYNELTNIINLVQSDINATKDAFEDHKYFWLLLEGADNPAKSTSYPEYSACSEVLPLFRELAIEYSEIDYEHFISPLEIHLQYLKQSRSTWYPDGEKSSTILPREWEQQLYEKELERKLEWYKKLTDDALLIAKRKRMVDIWESVKRGLDTSLDCLYLKYAYRQVARDINQLALEMNVAAIEQSLNMIRSAYKRIAKWKEADERAIYEIEASMDEEEKFAVEFN